MLQSPGMNDVQFVYDGKTLNGFSNGLQKSLPLSGKQFKLPTLLLLLLLDDDSHYDYTNEDSKI